jgi:transketolase
MSKTDSAAGPDDVYPVKVNLDPGVHVSTRDAFGEAITEIGRENLKVITASGDLQVVVRLCEFEDEFPDRFYNFGCAEQTMIGAAAGMATCGLIPVMATFSCFSSMRACEQVRTDVSYPRLNVKVVGTHGGLTQGSQGTTHHATEDIAIVRSFPNMTILVPTDAVEVRLALRAAIEMEGPVYFRIGRAEEPVVYMQEDYGFEIGKSVLLRHGDDATVIAAGQMVHAGLAAAHQLAGEGLQVRVINMHTIKPLDAEAVVKAARETTLIVTVEDHNIIGGLGSAVAEAAAETGAGAKVIRIGLPDIYAAVGDTEDLFEKYGMTSAGVIEAIKHNL